MDRQKSNGINSRIYAHYIHWSSFKNSNILRNDNRESQTYVHSSQVSICGQQLNEEAFDLDPGDYSKEFRFTLPCDLPPSFEHKYGRMRYTIQATLVIPGTFNEKLIQEFLVVNQLNLNDFPKLRQPVKLIDSKTFWYGPFKSHPIVIEFDVGKSMWIESFWLLNEIQGLS